MALRCAPIQINYLTTRARADTERRFRLTDEVSVPAGEERFFAKWCGDCPGFLNYNYDMVELPPIVPRRPRERLRDFRSSAAAARSTTI